MTDAPIPGEIRVHSVKIVLKNTMHNVIYIGGTFDIPHYGHVALLRNARQYVDALGGGEIVVAVNTDEFVGRFKRKPIFTLQERIQSVESWGIADKVVVNETDEDSKPMFLKYGATKVLFGSDYDLERYKRQVGVDDQWLKENNVDLVCFPYTAGISTTEIINRIKNYENTDKK